jgi:hypothetical protein
MGTDCIVVINPTTIPRLLHDQAVINEYECHTGTAKLSSYDNVFFSCFSSGCSKVLKLKILMDTLGQKYTTRAQNKAFWLASFPVQKHSQNYYASKSLQVYAKWINMNWKLIHMISTNTMQVEGVVHAFLVCLVVPSWLFKLVISHNFLLTKQY